MSLAAIAAVPQPEWQVLNEDCLEVLKRLPDNCLHSMVTDPPAGIGFMNKEWDSDKGGRVSWIAWLEGIMREALRVMKPGAHALVWALPRTSHWTATALEQAGFEIRDVVTHHQATGFPKSLNVSKALDASAGATREVIGTRATNKGDTGPQTYAALGEFVQSKTVDVTAPATDAAKQWDGWGTALKPASEHWVLARKPLIGTVAANVQTHGTGAINIDECRIAGPASKGGAARTTALGLMNDDGWQPTVQPIDRSMSSGRWPANLILSHSGGCFNGGCGDGCPVAALDAQSGIGKSGGANGVRKASENNSMSGPNTARVIVNGREPDQGGASRFFYVAKPSTKEREEGLAHLPKKRGAEITDRAEDSAGIQNPRAGAGRTSQGRANHHPTVKSIALMKYLVRLVTPPGGIVLDLFCGSGTTGIAAVLGGWSFLGVEKDPEYAAIARGRIAHWLGKQSS